jgi:cytochrome c
VSLRTLPFVGVLALWGAATSAQQAPNTQSMIDMAMQNMQRIMGGMSESDRMQYVTNAERDSLRRGEDLFSSTTLGTNGQACASCHPRGGTTGGQQDMMPGMRMPIPDLHGVAQTFPKFKVPNDAVITLAEMNNNCLVMFQRGTPLALNSPEARDLAAYVSSLK